MRYSCSISLRELKNAIKNLIFPLFRGSGDQNKIFKMGKNIGPGGRAGGKILGRLAFYTWVDNSGPNFWQWSEFSPFLISKSEFSYF